MGFANYNEILAIYSHCEARSNHVIKVVKRFQNTDFTDLHRLLVIMIAKNLNANLGGWRGFSRIFTFLKLTLLK